MQGIFSLILLLAAANLDTLLLALSWGVQRRKLRWQYCLLVALLTSAVTGLSLALGGGVAMCFPVQETEYIGNGLLIAFGLWVVLDWLRSQSSASTPQPTSLLGYGLLSLTLAVNNSGIGFAAGLTGASPLLAAVINFVLTVAALPLGCQLGHRVSQHPIARWATPLSGVLLMVMGVVMVR